MSEGNDGMGTPRQLQRRLTCHGVGQVTVAYHSAKRPCNSQPAKSERQGQGGLAVLGDREIFIVGNVAEMRALDIDSQLKLIGVEREVVGILYLYDQIQVAACETNPANYRPIKFDLRLPEVVTETSAGDG